MPAPTLVSTTRSTNYFSSSLPKSTPSVSWLAGDLILVTGITGDNSITLTNPPTATGLTFTSVPGFPSNTASSMKHYVWQATAGSNGSSVITSSVSSSEEGGISVRVWRDHTGIGAVAAAAFGTTGAPNRAITTTGDNSALDCGWSSWNQASGARTYLNVNGAAPTEDGYIDSASLGTQSMFWHADAGAAGSKTVGISAPTSTAWGCHAIEVLGTAATGGQWTASGPGTLGEWDVDLRSEAWY